MLATISTDVLGSPARAGNPIKWVPLKGLNQGAVYMVTGPQMTDRKRPVALFHHGYGATAKILRDSIEGAGERKVIEAFATAGYMVLVSDFGGSLWGNDTNHRHITALIGAGHKNGGRRGKVLLIGASMGGGAALSYAGMYPTRVAGVLGLIPALDLVAVRDVGYTVLDRAYQGGFSNAVHGGAHNPIVMAQTPHLYTPWNLSTSRFSAMPIDLWYATEDTVTRPETVSRFVATVRSRANANIKAHPRPGTHTDAFIGELPVQGLLRFARSVLAV